MRVIHSNPVNQLQPVPVRRHRPFIKQPQRSLVKLLDCERRRLPALLDYQGSGEIVAFFLAVLNSSRCHLHRGFSEKNKVWKCLSRNYAVECSKHKDSSESSYCHVGSTEKLWQRLLNFRSLVSGRDQGIFENETLP